MMRTYKDIRYTLTRSRRKTASIYIERDGQVTVLVPQDLSDAQVEKVLEGKRKWIYRHLAEWHDLNATRVASAVRQRRGIPVSRAVVPAEARQGAGRAAGAEGRLLLPACRSDGLPADAEAAFKAFYRAKGAARIPERVAYFQGRWRWRRRRSRSWT